MSRLSEPRYKAPTSEPSGLDLGAAHETPNPAPRTPAHIEKIDAPWQPMPSSPKDGNPVWLKSGEGKIVEGYWRRTRQFRKGMWQEIYYWAIWGVNPQSVPFNPVSWTRERPANAENSRAY
jgi:hypothetical protein